ncbi:hypothetical protein U9M48_041353 [Paspalum notatum var. saurae]|uniref:Uncharacterized protein n=1 Tax=Paspalum notatum var. saurae TaxID=547442 RepID=A0AAQ3USH6_PASNO
MDSGSSRNTKGKREAVDYGRDLKSYFSKGFSTTPSTHGSRVGLEALEREVVDFYFGPIVDLMCTLRVFLHLRYF